MICSRTIEYTDGDITFIGHLMWDNSVTTPRPGVLVAHAWGGCGQFEQEAAYALAEHGYVGFAIDMYGNGQLGTNIEENSALMTPLLENRVELLKRIELALATCGAQAEVDASSLAAIGLCFGGLCVLDLARSGADLACVTSFHGLFMPPESGCRPPIKASILALHGYDDPMAPPDAMLALANELTEAGADWQIHAYGNTQHAFTNPQANNAELGTLFNEKSRDRSFQTTINFLKEKLGS